MANEFIIRNGFISKDSSLIEGSLVVNNTITATTLSATTYQNLPFNISGTTNFIPLFSSSNALGDSIVSQTSGNEITVNGNLLIGTNTGTAKLQVRGSGATSGTTTLIIENSASTASLIVNDAGTINIGVAPITVTDSNDILVRNSSTGNIEVRTVSSVTSNSIQKSVGSTYTTNSILAVTQAEYDALTPDPTTLYFII